MAFTLSGPIPGSDAPPMTFPVYPLPSGLALLSGKSSVQTILATAVSSMPDVWSTGVPRTCGCCGGRDQLAAGRLSYIVEPPDSFSVCDLEMLNLGKGRVVFPS